jgi:hypothetical protein
MTTVRSSLRSSWLAALTPLFILIAGESTSAHRRDEYLQATRVAIDPDRVEIELDLTPGIAVAQYILSDIDLDRDGSISAGEARAYSARVLAAIALDIDGAPLHLRLIDTASPRIDAVLNGEGMTRIRAAADLPRLAAGPHHLRYRNAHRPDVGVYLANALVPASDRVAITAQRRDVDQRDLVIDYTLRADSAIDANRWLSIGMIGAFVCLVTLRVRSSSKEI